MKEGLEIILIIAIGLGFVFLLPLLLSGLVLLGVSLIVGALVVSAFKGTSTPEKD